MTKKPESVPAEAGTEPSEILAFLDTAPEPVKDWAKAQAQLIRQDQIRALQLKKKQEATPDKDSLDENELALAELGEVEEENPVFRKRAQRKAAKAAVAPAPAETAGTSDRRVILISLAVALVVGISSGAYFSNQASNNAVATEQAQMPSGHPDISEMNAVPVASLAELEARLLSDPEDIEALIQLGALRFDNGEIDKAEEHWLKVLDLDPEAVEAHYNLGFVYAATEPARWDDAAESWNRVIEIAPDSDIAANAKMHLSAVSSETSDPAQTDDDSTVAVDVDEEGESP